MDQPLDQPLDDDSDSPALEWLVEEAQHGQRLDQFLDERFELLSRSQIQKQIIAGAVRVDAVPARPSFKLKRGHVVTARIAPEPPEELIAEAIPLNVLYEDDDLVAIDKPAGMVVHPAKGHWRGTLTAALAYHFQQLSSAGGRHRPGIVHRLDRDTSGVILIAKNDVAHLRLTQQFEQRTVRKHYWAAVSPIPGRDRDLIDRPIGPHPYQREKMAIREHHPASRPAITFFEVIQRLRGVALLDVQPKTGRTHQIRVHLAHAGSPILCDRLYSGRATIATTNAAGLPGDTILARQALHARYIAFAHPRTGEPLEIAAPLPADLARLVDWLQTP